MSSAATLTAWTTRPLGECGQWISGGTPRTTEPSYWNGDIPWFSAKSLKNFDLQDAEDRVTRTGAENGSTLVPPGTILFVVRGMSLANELRVGITSRESALNQDLRGIITSKGVNARYLARYLKHGNAYLSLVDNASHGTKRLDSERLKSLEVPLPPLSEQRRIADILDKADVIRRKRREAVSSIGDVFTSHFQRFFARELQSASRCPLNEHLVELRYGTSCKSSSEGKPTLRIPNVVRGIVDLHDLKYVPVSASDFERLALKSGDILFVRTNGNPDYVGRCAVFDADAVRDAGYDPAEFIYASYLIRGRLNLTSLHPQFLQHFLQTTVGRRALRDRCRTSAGQYNINTEGIGSIEIPVVSMERQEQFARHLSLLKHIHCHLSAAVGDCDDLVKALVGRAFKGDL